MKIAQKFVAVFLSTAVAAVMAAPAFAREDDHTGKTQIHHGKVYTVKDEATRMFKDMEEHSYNLFDHAATLRAGASVPYLDRDFFIDQINAVKEHANAIGKEIARLDALSSFQDPAEQNAILHAKPQLEKIAATATETIHFINEHAPNPELQQYQQLSARLCDQSEALWKMLHDSVRLSDIKVRERQLKSDLAVAEVEK